MMIFMKKYFFLLILLISLNIFSANIFAAENLKNDHSKIVSLNKIVAIVNNDIITQNELNAKFATFKKSLGDNFDNSQADALKKDLLQQIINEKLQLEIAKENNIKISEEELKKEITNIAKKNNLSVSQLYESVYQNTGLSKNQYLENLKNQLIIYKLIQQTIAQNINITADDINNYIKSIKQNSNSASIQYNVVDVLLPTPTKEKNIKAQAETVIKELKKNTSFEQLSNKIKDVKINYLGWRELNNFPELFTDKIKNMKVNDVSNPIEAPNGLHILKLLNTKTPEITTEDRKQISQIIFQKKLATEADKYVKKLRDSAYIKIFPT